MVNVTDTPHTNATEPSGTAMRAQTAAKKLGIYLPAAPEDFQANAVTHAELRELQENPPEWLATHYAAKAPIRAQSWRKSWASP